VVSFVDATERRKAEEAAHWTRAIVDASWDAIIGTDAQGTITSWSPGAERMYGYTAAEARGRDISLIVAPDRPDEAHEIMARLRRGERVQDFETVRVGKDGSRREVSISLSCIRSADGTIRGIAGTSRDVTERRAAERQMQVMQDIALAASAAAGVDETLEAALRILCQATGLPLAEAWLPASESRLQRRAHWVRPDQREPLGAFLDDWPLERGTSLPGSAWQTKQAVWTADLGLSSYPRAGLAAELGIGAGVAAPVLVDGEVVAVIDGFFTGPREVDPALMALLTTVGAQIGTLVQRRRAEEALRKSEEQLRQAQKMEAIGQLTGGVAHDFNNLLSVILSYSGMLAEDLEPNDPRRQDLLEIKTAGERAAALTQQLLAFSRRQVLQPRVVDLNQIVAGVEKMLRRLIGEDVELIVVSAPAPARANVDRGQMEQVIVNLAVNARDAMPTGGKLTIAIASVELDEAFASEHAGVTAGPHILLSVTDTGCGMDAVTQGHAYEPFFTTKERGKGTGLGLPTVFGIVRQSAGTIWLYSEPGKGTTFKIYLPRAEAGAEVAIPRPVELVRLHGSETVLLVEDEEGVRKLARSILQRAGYRVLEATDSAHALLLAGEHGAIDLLLTDVVMPQMSGAEIATRVLAQRPGLKLLYMSGYTDNAVVLHGVLRSEAAFVQKPFTPAVLLSKVREVLDAPPAKAEARG
jgi:PAS domain S-box-containing protein